VPSDVFRDGGEVGLGVGSASREIGFTGILMEKFARVADDPQEMRVRGFGERTVPAEGREFVLGPGLIGEFEKSLLGG
jgi:hypothetical protein